jgi:PST family polysaccharide transporter
MAMPAVFTTIAELFSSLGAGPLIVQRREVPDPFLRSVAFMGVIVGLLLTALLILGGWLSAGFFAEPRVQGVVMALGGTFAISSFGLVPDALLQRAMRFDRLVLIDMLVLISSSTVSITLAFLGWGVWALVAGNLTGAAARSAALVIASPWPLRFGFDRAALRGAASFSASVLGFNLVQYLARYTDRVLIGKMLGATSLGLYDYAFRFYTYPLDVLTNVLVRVMLPTFSRIQGNVEQLGRAFLRANGAIAFVTFPMMAGLAVVADPFVNVVLGEQWRPIIPLIQIMAPVAMLTAMGATTGQIFLASGKAAFRFWWSIVYTTVIVIGVAVGVRWGIQGVAAALAIVMVPINVVAFWLALRLVRLGLGDLWRALWSTAALTASMVVLVTVLRVALTRAQLAAAFVLAICVAAGALFYVVGVRRFPPHALNDLYDVLPAAVRRQRLVTWLFARTAS